MVELRKAVAKSLPDPLEATQERRVSLSTWVLWLRAFGGPDWEILAQGKDCFAKGVVVGYDKPIERFSQERVVSDLGPDCLGGGHGQFLFSMQTCRLSDWRRSSQKTSKKVSWCQPRLGQRGSVSVQIVAAMGAIERPDGSVRPLHGGTRGVNLNNKIVIKDRLEVPDS